MMQLNCQIVLARMTRPMSDVVRTVAMAANNGVFLETILRSDSIIVIAEWYDRTQKYKKGGLLQP